METRLKFYEKFEICSKKNQFSGDSFTKISDKNGSLEMGLKNVLRQRDLGSASLKR